jgi:hypothetical protein
MHVRRHQGGGWAGGLPPCGSNESAEGNERFCGARGRSPVERAVVEDVGGGRRRLHVLVPEQGFGCAGAVGQLRQGGHEAVKEDVGDGALVGPRWCGRR